MLGLGVLGQLTSWGVWWGKDSTRANMELFKTISQQKTMKPQVGIFIEGVHKIGEEMGSSNYHP